MPHLSEGRPGRRSLIVGEGTTAVQFRSVSGDLRVVGPNSSETFTIPKPPTPPMPPTAPTAPTPPTPPDPPQPAGAGALAEAAAKLDAELADLDAELSVLDAEVADVDLDEPANATSADAPDATPAPADDERLEILRALERGEIDVDEATKRLAGLDGPTDD
jgi:hypothetical protein